MRLSKRLAGFFGCFLSVSAIAPFYISSVDTSAVVTSVDLTPAETLALYGSSISGYYCSSEGVYKSCTFNYLDTISGSFSSGSRDGLYDPDGVYNLSYINSRDFLLYYVSSDDLGEVAYSSTSENIDFQFQLVPSVSLSNLYLFNSSVGFGSQYPHLNYNYVWSISDYPSSVDVLVSGVSESFSVLPFSSSSLDRVGFINISFGSPIGVSFIPISISDNNSPFTLGYQSIDLFHVHRYTGGGDYNNYYFFFVECPTLSDGFSSGGSGSGSGNVTGQLNSDGSIDLTVPDYSEQLATIISKLDQIAVSSGYNDLVSSDLNSAASSFNSSVDSYLDADESLWDNLDSNLDTLDSIDFEEPLRRISEDSNSESYINVFRSFFDIQTLWGWMVLTALIFAVLSYIIFGKSG